MSIERTQSIKYSLERLYRDYGIKYEIPFDDFIEWGADVLRFTGVSSQYVTTDAVLKVENHRACFPLNFYKIVLVTHCGHPLMFGGKPFDNGFHCDKCLNLRGDRQFNKNHPTYNVNDSYIITSFECGEICLEYLAIATDCEGFPLVPDNIYYEKAITAYVIYMIDRIQWRMGLLPDKVYQESKQDWEWYIAAASASGKMPSLNQMERIKNIMVRLIPQENSFNNGFTDLGNRESIYIK